MITIIAGTDRKGSNTKKVALEYKRFLQEENTEALILSLDEFDIHLRNDAFIQMEKEYLIAADRFIFIMPEYNGSYPGVLKMMIDNTDVANVWWHKKALLTGVSSGRAGNLRGMEHITGSLLHMKMIVHPNRLPLSTVNMLMNAENIFTDALAIASVRTQLKEFIDF